MKSKNPNAAEIWKQFEDLVVPRLNLSLVDRTIYSRLLRYSHLEGQHRLRFSIAWLARGAGLCNETARQAVRRLVGHGALRLLERSKEGHVVEVRLPGEIRAGLAAARPVRGYSLEETDYTKTHDLREAIHAREGGSCFYCLRRLSARARCLDHVVPVASLGRNSYRNLVSCCVECNTIKGERRAEDFLRELYRERRLTADEFAARLRALDALASGKPPLFREGLSSHAR